MIKVSSHTIDESLIVENSWVIDVGCRDFQFAKYCVERGAKVIALDPDENIEDPKIPNITYIRKAVVGYPRGKVFYSSWSSGEGNFIGDVPIQVPNSKIYTVSCTTLGEISREYKIEHFSCLKLDCEGSEYEILLNCPLIFNQMSIEFHDFVPEKTPSGGYQKFYQTFLGRIKDKYDIVQHEYFKQHEYMNHWDSLFKMKNIK